MVCVRGGSGGLGINQANHDTACVLPVSMCLSIAASRLFALAHVRPNTPFRSPQQFFRFGRLQMPVRPKCAVRAAPNPARAGGIEGEGGIG